jgi:chromosome segregation ATPase
MKTNIIPVLNSIWGLVYSCKTNWEYAGQIFAHVKQFISEKDDTIESLRKELEDYRHSASLSDELTYNLRQELEASKAKYQKLKEGLKEFRKDGKCYIETIDKLMEE